MPEPTQPAHTLLYDAQSLAPPTRGTPQDIDFLAERVGEALGFNLNERQRVIFQQSFEERLSLLWGPPGTGKTKTLAAIALGWIIDALSREEPVSICVGSSNWTAVDNVLGSIADLLEARERGTTQARLVRLRGEHSERPSDERVEDVVRTSQTATELANQLDTEGALPLADTSSLIIGGTWQQLSKLAGRREEGQTTQPRGEWFDLLLIDEASQVRVTTAAGYFLLLKPEGHVVLAGDHRQLGPVYKFNTQEIAAGNALYDCIFTYMQEEHGINPTALNQNYRTNREIAAWPRIRFYNNDYEAHFSNRRLEVDLPTGRPPTWPEGLPWSNTYLRILDPEQPIVVVTYPSRSYTLSNPQEAVTVAALCALLRTSLQTNGDNAGDTFWQDHLGIVTPHRAQMAHVRNLLVSEGGFENSPPPAVDTVDRFQGRERDCIVASYAVSDKDFAAQEEAFILSSRRFNVTLTRARSKFIMLISEALLRYLPTDMDVAEDAAHLQRFVTAHCEASNQVQLPDLNGQTVSCQLRMPYLHH